MKKIVVEENNKKDKKKSIVDGQRKEREIYREDGILT